MNRTLLRWLIIPAYERLTGRRRYSHLKRLLREQWESPEETKLRVERRLEKLLEHAVRNVPYYRSLFRGAGLGKGHLTAARLPEMPVLTKAEIRENLESLIAENWDRSSLLKSGTGGSVGDPVQFYHDLEQEERRNAAHFLGDWWAGWRPGNRYLWLWSSPVESALAGSRLVRMKWWVNNQLYLDTFDLSTRNLEKYVRKYNRFKPDNVVGYASSLAVFSNYVKERGWKLHSPKSVISSAEALFPEQRRMIESAFGCRVFNRYGCREVGLIAAECPEEGRLHVNCANLHLEILRNGKPVPPGEVGEVVVTDLNGLAMPFIRYVNGDLAALATERCPCGRSWPVLKEVAGRVHEVIVTPEGGYMTGMFFTHLLKDYPGIVKFQVFQDTPDHVVLKIVPGAGFRREVLEKVRRSASSRLGAGVKFETRLVDVIEPGPGGKHRVTVSVPGRAKIPPGKPLEEDRE